MGTKKGYTKKACKKKDDHILYYQNEYMDRGTLEYLKNVIIDEIYEVDPDDCIIFNASDILEVTLETTTIVTIGKN